MKKILFLKTASDLVMDQLIKELAKEYKYNNMYCLIQSSLIHEFQQKYSGINFTDIEKEGFYNISNQAVHAIKNICFNVIYIPTTGVHANNFWNIMELVSKLQYRELIFYNSNGKMNRIKRKTKLEEKIIELYIRIIRIIISFRG